MNAEDLLFLLYTSGHDGEAEGDRHTTGGYLTQRRDDAQARLRFEGGRATCIGAPPTSAG